MERVHQPVLANFVSELRAQRESLKHGTFGAKTSKVPIALCARPTISCAASSVTRLSA